MRRSFVVLAFFLLVPALLWAATPATSLIPLALEPNATMESYQEYNDGWIDVFKVPIIGTDAVEPRGRNGLDAFDSTFFFDDLEGTYAPWVTEDLTIPPDPYWHLDDTLALGATGQAWYCGDTTLTPAGYGGGYADEVMMHLISDTLNFSAATSPINLAFKARWSVETPGGETPPYDMWDGWNVWASTDLGATWSLLTPTSPAYTGNNSFAWGDIWGYGAGIGAYGGTNADYTDISFSLNALAGNGNVLLRWSFASDGGFSSLDDPSMFGVVIDSIRVTDASTTLYSNDGTEDELISTTGNPPASGTTWEYLAGSATEYHSATHAWHAPVDTSLLQTITSPSVVIPTGYDLVRARYWVYCDMPDTDGDNDDALDDFFDFWVNDVDSGTFRRIVYDWAKDFGNPAPDGNSALGWVLRSQAAHPGTGGYTLGDIVLTPWAGRTVKIMFRHRTDPNDDGGVGTGLYIDDVELWCTRAFAVDMASRDFNFNFPTTVGLTQSYNYTLYNAGLDLLGNQLRHRIRFYRPNGTQWFDSSIVTSGSLALGQDTVLYRNWTPQVTGSHRMWVYATYVGEQDRSNDTSRTPTNVPLNADSNLAVTVRQAGEYELAYHMRSMANAFLNPRYIRYTPLADGVPTDSAAIFDITKVRIVWQFDATIADSSATSWIEFWSDSLPDYPGHLLKRFEVEIDTSETIGALGRVHWWTLDVSGTPELSGLSGNFWVSVTPKDSIAGGPAPLPMGRSVDPVVYDGHNFVVRLDSLNAFRPSPGRYLVQTTIVPSRMPGTVEDLVVIRDGVTNDVTLTWDATINATGYKVYRMTSPTQDYLTGTLLTPTPITATTYTDSGILSSATKNFYVVVAVH